MTLPVSTSARPDLTTWSLSSRRCTCRLHLRRWFFRNNLTEIHALSETT